MLTSKTSKSDCDETMRTSVKMSNYRGLVTPGLPRETIYNWKNQFHKGKRTHEHTLKFQEK